MFTHFVSIASGESVTRAGGKRPEMAPEGDGWNGTRVSHAAQFESASKRAQHSTQMGVLLTETLCVESDGVGGYGSHGKHKDVEV